MQIHENNQLLLFCHLSDIDQHKKISHIIIFQIFHIAEIICNYTTMTKIIKNLYFFVDKVIVAKNVFCTSLTKR